MTTKWISKVACIVALVGGATVLGAAGCGPSASALCNKGCDCTGCSDSEYDECVDSFEDAQKAADDEGCSDQYSDYIGCVNDEFECRDGDVDIDGCDAEVEALFVCLS